MLNKSPGVYADGFMDMQKKKIFFSKFTLEYILTVRYAIYSSLIRTAWFLPPSYMCVATFKSQADAEQVTRSKRR